MACHVAPEHALLAMASYMAAVNIRTPTAGFDASFLIAPGAMPEAMWPVAAAHAVEMILGGGYSISDGFRQSAMHWFEDLGHLSEPARSFVIARIEDAWRGYREESPIARAERLGLSAQPFARRTLRDITGGITGSFPQQFPLPDHTL